MNTQVHTTTRRGVKILKLHIIFEKNKRQRCFCTLNFGKELDLLLDYPPYYQ